MKCEETIEQLSAFLDGELSAEEQEAVRTHLEACPHCREELEALRKTVESVRGLPPLRAPKHLREKVAAAVAADKARPERISRLRTFWPVAAALLLAAVVYLFDMSSKRRETARVRSGPVAMHRFTGQSGPPAAASMDRETYMRAATEADASSGRNLKSDGSAPTMAYGFEGAYMRGDAAQDEVGKQISAPISPMLVEGADGSSSTPAMPAAKPASSIWAAGAPLDATPSPATAAGWTSETAGSAGTALAERKIEEFDRFETGSKEPAATPPPASQPPLPSRDIVVLTNNVTLARQRVAEMARSNKWQVLPVETSRLEDERVQMEFRNAPGEAPAGAITIAPSLALKINDSEVVLIGNALAEAGLLGPGPVKDQLEKEKQTWGFTAGQAPAPQLAQYMFLRDGQTMQQLIEQQMSDSQRQMLQRTPSAVTNFSFDEYRPSR